MPVAGAIGPVWTEVLTREYYPGADDLVRYLADFADHHRLAVRYRTAVERVEKTTGGFLVHTARTRCIAVNA